MNDVEVIQAWVDLLDRHGRIRALEDVEKRTIQFALALCGDNKDMAAFYLKIGRSTLYRKLGEYGLSGE